jgi:hypothetical protein
MIQFDHIEVHVRNSIFYANFLLQLFNGGRYKKISDNNTFMFLSSDNIRIEIKENPEFKNLFKIENDLGFCLPCIRMNGAIRHLEKIGNITIVKIIDNPDGKCIFLKIMKALIGISKIMKY